MMFHDLLRKSVVQILCSLCAEKCDAFLSKYYELWLFFCSIYT